MLWDWLGKIWRRRNKHLPAVIKVASRVRLQLEALEERATPVVGANAIPGAVVSGTGQTGSMYEGVVRITDTNGNTGSGALLSDRTHVLTAAHILTQNDEQQVLFELVRNDGTVANKVIPIKISVPQNVNGWSDQIIHPQFNGATLANDIALLVLPDQVPGPNQKTSRLVAPYYGPDTGYQLYAGNALNQNFTMVGYGQSGTGTTGEQGDEVQQVQIQNPVANGTFTLAFNGETTAAIPQNATAAQVAAALQPLVGVDLKGNSNISVSNVGLGASSWNVRFVGSFRPC